jgi:hypothetical protein
VQSRKDWTDNIKLVEHELQDPTLYCTENIKHSMNSSEAIPLFYRQTLGSRKKFKTLDTNKNTEEENL